LEPKTKLLESDLEDEDNDLEFFNPNLEMKSTSLKEPTQGALIDLYFMLNIQKERSQQPLEVQSDYVLEPSCTSIGKLPILESISTLNLLMALRRWNISSHLKPHLDCTSS
jgi:hypothetical protein